MQTIPIDIEVLGKEITRQVQQLNENDEGESRTA